MATNFPTSLDSYSTKTDNVDDVMAGHPNDLQDAVEALEAKVGVDGSAVTTSHDYKLAHIGGLFGAPEARSNNTVYQAGSDSFVVALNNNGALMKVYAGTDNPPTTELGIAYGGYNTLSIPIRKGEYYKTTGATSVWWRSWGS
ncbi:MAG: hypothetical protein AMJ72_06365 [Acidithiobacillales bacterium SM1_46]|nr:MAG: hypothetical protein AMJ72_06365 [Acidithiobacillales bacterium SM1_46]